MNTEDSRSISMLRFPMAVLVILLHADVICQSKNTLIYNNGIGEFMITLCSNGVCQLAVPCFALISGYLFFGGLKDFSWPIWTEKIRRRVHTLLIPYVLWNTLALLWMVAYGYILHTCRGVDFSLSTVWNDVGGVRFLWDGWCNLPVDGPLWYIRNLMLIVIFSPIIYVLIKKLKATGIATLMFLYIVNIWPSWHWLLCQVVCMFAIGGYLRINCCSLICQNTFANLLSLAVTLAALAIMVFSFNQHQKAYSIALHVFTLTGCLILFVVADKLSVHQRFNTILSTLGASSLFLYASHRFMVVDVIKTVLWSVLPIGNQYALAGAYILLAVSTTAVCYGLYVIMQRFTPRVLSLLIGGR